MRRGMTNRNQFGMVGSRKSSKRESEKLGNQRKNEYDVVEKNTVFNHMRNYVFFCAHTPASITWPRGYTTGISPVNVNYI